MIIRIIGVDHIQGNGMMRMRTNTIIAERKKHAGLQEMLMKGLNM